MVRLSPHVALFFLLTVLPSLAVNFPVGITNCGISSWIGESPQRAITMNQGTTEILLALGLADRTVGTAYLDDEIWQELAEEYAKVPVLSEGYPTPEQIRELSPDFLYASYSSAFATSHVNYTEEWLEECSLISEQSDGSNRTHCRQELHEKGIQTYLQEPFCELVEHRPEKLTMDVLLDEIWDIATIFDVLDNGRQVIDRMQEHFAQALDVSQAAANNREGEPVKVLWLDSINADGEPFVGACCGAVQIILEHAGAVNVFEDVGVEERRSWMAVSWEEVIATDPDLIVVVEASWDSVEEKIFNLCNKTDVRNLRAVQNRAFLTVPFSGSTLGVRIGSLAYNLAEAMASLVSGTPLPSLEFSPASLSDDSRAVVTQSGVKVYTRLPQFVNKEDGINVDLDTYCPGSSDVTIADIRDPESIKNAVSSDNTLEGWAIGLITGFAIVIVGALSAVAILVSREKSGKPIFASEQVSKVEMH